MNFLKIASYKSKIEHSTYYYLIVLCLCMPLLNTTGFDLYAHTHSYLYNVTTASFYNFGDLFYVPRYIVLSYYYNIISILKIPFGISAILILLPPIRDIFHHLTAKREVTGIFASGITLLTLLTCFFYSSMALAVLYLVAYSFTKKKFFFIGAFFHPLAIFIYVFHILFFYSKESLRQFTISIIAICIFIMLFSSIYYHFNVIPMHDSIKGTFSLGSISSVNFFSLIYLKKNELFLAVIFLFCYKHFSSFRLIKLPVRKPFLMCLVASFFFTSIFLYSSTRNYFNVFTYLFSNKYNAAISVTWTNSLFSANSDVSEEGFSESRYTLK